MDGIEINAAGEFVSLFVHTVPLEVMQASRQVIESESFYQLSAAIVDLQYIAQCLDRALLETDGSAGIEGIGVVTP